MSAGFEHEMPRLAPDGRPRVLMVTGAYYPELSGAGLQCRALIQVLADRVRCVVLTTATDPALAANDLVDGVPVYRIHIDVNRWTSTAAAFVRMVRRFLALRRDIDIVHLHGFSRKSVLLVRLAHLLGKKIVVKLTSVGHDDAVSMRRKGGMELAAYSQADAYIGVSPQFEVLYRSAGFTDCRLRRIPNGVDLTRFRPSMADDRRALRRELGLREDLILVLFVGFFSHEKAPGLLFDAWVDTLAAHPATGLVFVGVTQSRYYEIDRTIGVRVHRDAERLGIADRLSFVESTFEIEKYYRAVDAFALPSLREGLPNALLEAMAAGLPSVVSRLPGVTDAIIEDGASGLLVPAGDRPAFARALASLFDDGSLRQRLGATARRTVEKEYPLDATADRHVALYRDLLGDRPA
jgi:glycosyltransferase involved in cell wall biosynthesis